MKNRKYTIDDLSVIKEITLENINLLKETKELILKMKLFTPICEDKCDNEFKIIHDFEKANHYAFGEDYGNEGNWTDLREGIWAEVNEKKYELKHYKELEVSNRIYDVCHPPIPQYLNDEAIEVYNEISGDLEFCLISRLISGKSNKFLESMFKAYLTGGWPCGWKGNYPDGNLIVYYPKN